MAVDDRVTLDDEGIRIDGGFRRSTARDGELRGKGKEASLLVAGRISCALRVHV